MNEAPAQSSPTAQPLPTTRPTAVPTSNQPTIPGKDEVYFVKIPAQARGCARWDCDALETLQPGMRIKSLRYVTGQPADGNVRWIRFIIGARVRYIHSGLLSKDKPVTDPTPESSPTATRLPTESATSTETESAPPIVESTATPPPTEPPPTMTATVIDQARFVVETERDQNANIRSCPRTTCAIVAKFAAGTEVDVIDRVSGETVYGTDEWIEIRLDADTAYIHSALVERSK